MRNVRTAVIAVAATAITIGALWFTNRAVTPKKATWEEVEAEAKSAGYRLISLEELREDYVEGSKNILLVDTRQEWEYRTGHIKGALNFPMEPTWLSQWQKRSALERLMGPDKNRFIVFY